MHDLATIEALTPAEVFTDKGADPIIDRIEKEARAALIDISTDAGRKECASIAYKIARSKTFLDDMGKDLVSEWKGRSAKVDAERRKIRDRLDALKDEIRKPLTDFENAETMRVAEHENRIALIDTLHTFEQAQPTAQDIQNRLAAISEHMQRDWEEFGKRATEIADATRASLQAQLTVRQKYDADQAELQRLRDEAAKREQADREERIRREAAEKAQREADLAIAAAKAREEAAHRATEQAKIDAERQAKEAAEAATRAAQEAADAAKRAAKESAEREERVREAAAKAERDRIERERIAEEAAAAKREANKKHRAKINTDALEGLRAATGLDFDSCKLAIEAIAKGAVPSVTISY